MHRYIASIVKIFTKVNSKYLYYYRMWEKEWQEDGLKAYYERLRDLREDHDLTQEQVAKALGTSQTMYARYERGANELPLRHLTALCRLYHVSADSILGLNEKND